MKIVVFTETYLPTVNGVVNSIELFREELTRRGHEVFVIAPHSSAENFKARSHVFRLPSLPLIGQPSHPIAWQRLNHIRAIFDEVQPDIVHVQGMFSCGWMGKRVALQKGIPAVLTYHTHLEGYAHYAGPLAGLLRPLLRFWTKKFAAGFDVVITPSPSMAKILKRYGVKNDIVALPTGIHLKDFVPGTKAEKRKNLQFDPETIYLISVGRLAEEKNIRQLLDDFGRLHVRNRSVHLILAGDGPDRRPFEAMVKLRGLGEAVTFLGTVPHQKLIDYFIASDVFVFPSLTDTQGIVLIEAFASELPCVVYDALGPGDIVQSGENGLKARPGTDQFFQYMLQVVENLPLREKLGLGALREARKYSIEKTADQMEQLYTVLTPQKAD